MTKPTASRYVLALAKGCPLCPDCGFGNGFVVEDGEENQSSLWSRRMKRHCKRCGAEWTDVYEFVRTEKKEKK